MRKFFLILFILVVLVVGGMIFYVSTHEDDITNYVAKKVEELTGSPLKWETPPKFSVFPKLGLQIGKVSWGDPQKNPVSVEVDTAIVKVAFLPLFSKRIELDQVILESPKISIKDTPATQTEKKPTPASDTPGQADQEAASVFDAIQIGMIKITNGDVAYSSKDQRIKLSNLNLTIADMALNKEGSVSISTGMSFDPQHMDFNLDSSFKLTMLSQQLNVRKLNLTLNPIKGLPISKPVNLKGDMDIDTTAQSARIPGIVASLPGFELTASGNASLHGSNFNIQGKGSLKDVLAALGISIATRDPRALSSLDANFKLNVDDNVNIKVNDLDAKLDATAIKGLAQYAANGKITAKLSLDSIDIDNYLPPKEAEKATPSGQAGKGGNNAAEMKKLPAVDVELDAGKIIASGISLSDLKMKIAGQQGVYTIAPCTFKLYEAAVAAHAKADLPATKYDFALDFKNMNLAPLHMDLLKNDTVTGYLDVGLAYSLSGADEAAMRRSLNGKGTISGKNVNVRIVKLPDWLQSLRDVKNITIDSLLVENAASQGVVTITPITATGPMLKANGKGTVNLPADAVNMRIDAAYGAIQLPVVISGSLSNPSYGLDSASVVKNVVDILKSGDDKKLVDDAKKGASAILKGVTKDVRTEVKNEVETKLGRDVVREIETKFGREVGTKVEQEVETKVEQEVETNAEQEAENEGKRGQRRNKRP
jgi:AsmA protein